MQKHFMFQIVPHRTHCLNTTSTTSAALDIGCFGPCLSIVYLVVNDLKCCVTMKLRAGSIFKAVRVYLGKEFVVSC